MKKLIFLFSISAITQLSATTIHQNKLYYSNVYMQYNLGVRYKYLRKKTPKNLHKAFNLLHKAALRGHTLSQYELALMFHYGQGVRQNAELARLWFTRAAKRGHIKAQDVLYRFYSAKKPKYLKIDQSRFSQNFR